MYKRALADFLLQVAPKYPVITLVGPRQSGKSTLSRMVFPDYTYVSLEEPDRRNMAMEDPRGFFRNFPGALILDEVQRVPELLSYIQTLVDEPHSQRKFVLTGSHQLLLMEKVTQSLAGRTVITKLLPFSRKELVDKNEELEFYLFQGGYPRIYDKKLNPTQWLEQYYQTYVERDVRSLLRVAEIDLFDRFLRLCAGRVGQILNLSSLANDCGISQPTARAWLSVLQASFIAFTLHPHFKNFNKRIIKSPKIYFYDSGLLCYLLKIRNQDSLREHAMRGNIFENWVITERMKSFYNQGAEPPFYFWRDAKGHEIDLIIDEGHRLFPVEIKSAYTFHPSFLNDMIYLNALQNAKKPSPPLGECIYGGKETLSYRDFSIRSWQEL